MPGGGHDPHQRTGRLGRGRRRPDHPRTQRGHGQPQECAEGRDESLISQQASEHEGGADPCVEDARPQARHAEQGPAHGEAAVAERRADAQQRGRRRLQRRRGPVRQPRDGEGLEPQVPAERERADERCDQPDDSESTRRPRLPLIGGGQSHQQQAERDEVHHPAGLKDRVGRRGLRLPWPPASSCWGLVGLRAGQIVTPNSVSSSRTRPSTSSTMRRTVSRS